MILLMACGVISLLLGVIGFLHKGAGGFGGRAWLDSYHPRKKKYAESATTHVDRIEIAKRID